MGRPPRELRTATQAQQTSGPTHTGINQHPHRPPLPREEPVSQDSTHDHEDPQQRRRTQAPFSCYAAIRTTPTPLLPISIPVPVRGRVD